MTTDRNVEGKIKRKQVSGNLILLLKKCLLIKRNKISKAIAETFLEYKVIYKSLDSLKVHIVENYPCF